MAQGLAVVGLIGSTMALVLWLVVLSRVRRVLRDPPAIRAGLDRPAPEGGWPRVSIIVPAHNEERGIDVCAASLRAQRYDDLEIIFVLDRCTDRTLELLRPHADADARVRIIENDDCPDDWLGKCNAVRLGTVPATGAYLLFIDADTTAHPDLVRAAVATAEDEGFDLISLLSDLTLHQPHERMVQPVAAMSLIRLYPLERVNRREHPRPFANGQFMLFKRTAYETMGGHETVKRSTMEDVELARALHQSGGRGGIFLADGMFTCSMYEGWDDFRRGWQRIFAGACSFKPSRLRSNAFRLLLTGLGFPAAQIASLVAAPLLAGTGSSPAFVATLVVLPIVGWITQLLGLAGAYRLGNMPVRAIVFYPFACLEVARIMLRSASDLTRRKPMVWGGKEYVVDPR